MRVLSSQKVMAYCEKHKYVDHVEYTKEDNTKKYVCLTCKHSNPHMYPLYGKKQPSVTTSSIDTTFNYGRQVI